jgi:four helix bundle protein
MGDYHKLEVWHLATKLSDRIYAMVETLGSRLRPSQVDQITRSADAIHENIAEGCGFNSDPQLAKYLRQALGSADEVQDELETLQRRRLLPQADADLLPAVKLICRKTSTFLQTVEGRKPRPPKPRRRRKPQAEQLPEPPTDI